MIRIEIGRGKSKVEAYGNFYIISSEMTYALKKIYDVISGEIGEEAAEECIKSMAKLAVMDEKDLEEKYTEITGRKTGT